MQNTKITLIFLMSILMASLVAAIPVMIDTVKVNDVVLSNNSINPLDVERGQQLSIAVTVIGQDTIGNVEVEAFISGFEFSDVARVSDVTPVFDVVQNVTYVKHLTIPLPDSLQNDNYKLRVVVSDRNNDELVQNYNLRIDVPRHLVNVKDVILTPQNEIAAGGSLVASVRVENLGAKAEDDVKVNVAIPQLGVSATKYINKVGVNAETETEDVYLRIPECASPGSYNVVSTVYYNDGHRTVKGSTPIQVTRNELCDSEGSTAESPSKVLIAVGSTLESVAPGNNAVFPITVSNKGRTSKSFTVLPAMGDWGTVKMSPTTTAVLAPGKSETFYIFVTPNQDAPSGANMVTAEVSSSGEMLQQVALTANVVKAPDMVSTMSLKRVLELGLIVLLVLLIIVGLIVGFSMLRDENDDFPPQQPEPYY